MRRRLWEGDVRRCARRQRLMALICAVLLVVGAAAPLHWACSQEESEYTKVSELSGKRVGMVVGTAFDKLIAQKAGKDFVLDPSYFSSTADAAQALAANRIDALVNDEPIVQLIVNRNPGIVMLPEPEKMARAMRDLGDFLKDYHQN